MLLEEVFELQLLFETVIRTKDISIVMTCLILLFLHTILPPFCLFFSKKMTFFIFNDNKAICFGLILDMIKEITVYDVKIQLANLKIATSFVLH